MKIFFLSFDQNKPIIDILDSTKYLNMYLALDDRKEFLILLDVASAVKIKKISLRCRLI